MFPSGSVALGWAQRAPRLRRRPAKANCRSKKKRSTMQAAASSEQAAKEGSKQATGHRVAGQLSAKCASSRVARSSGSPHHPSLRPLHPSPLAISSTPPPPPPFSLPPSKRQPQTRPQKGRDPTSHTQPSCRGRHVLRHRWSIHREPPAFPPSPKPASSLREREKKESRTNKAA